jgi:hypothetical protein
MSAPSVSRIGPVAHRQEVGDFSIGIMGIFASALTEKLNQVPLGFDAHNILLFDLNLHGKQYDSDETLFKVLSEVQSRLSSVPGVMSNTFSSIALAGNDVSLTNFDRSSYLLDATNHKQ